MIRRRERKRSAKERKVNNIVCVCVCMYVHLCLCTCTYIRNFNLSIIVPTFSTMSFGISYMYIFILFNAYCGADRKASTDDDAKSPHVEILTSEMPEV